MPVFHQDGGLVGIIAPDRSGARVLPVEAALAAATNPLPERAPFGLTMAVQRTANGNAEIAITDVAPDGIAARAGLGAGDIVVAVDGEPVGPLEHVVPRLAGASDARGIRVRVRRGKRMLDRQLLAPAATLRR